MKKTKKETLHILTFLADVRRFTHKNGSTALLKVDKDNCVEDLSDVFSDASFAHPAAIIAEMQNVCGDIIDNLRAYYTETNNKQALKRLDKLSKTKY
jgi:hypothetical protein